MRRAMASFSLLLFLVAGCEHYQYPANQLPDSAIELTDGFCIVSGDQVVLNHHDIDHYDYGTHLIYLKEHRSLSEILEQTGGLTVYAGGEEIYGLSLVSGCSSYAPQGPFIWTDPTFYADNVIAIDLIWAYVEMVQGGADPREDPRIVEALEKYGQFRNGLQCEIVSIQFSAPDDVVVELKLRNEDAENYYYLDPEKMGMGLYHYFTNGVTLRDAEAEQSYTHQVDYIQPDPWDSWDLEWMSLLESNSSVSITIAYDHFDEVPPGTYSARFRFPGLAYQVEREEMEQRHGRIWLGNLQMNSEVVVE